MRSLTISACVGLTCLAPATASAAVTFGNTLFDTPDEVLSKRSTTIIRSTPANRTAGGGPSVPARGVIVTWRVKTLANAAVPAFHLRVMRGNTSVHQGPEVGGPGPLTAGVHEFPARAPVEAGDQIGIDNASFDPNTVTAIALTASGTFDTWTAPLAPFPLLGPTETRAPTFDDTPGQLLVNADLEADADGDGFGDETQDVCPSQASTQGACDVTAPSPEVDKKPKKKTKSSKATFLFSSDDPTATFQCAIDKKPLAPCTSPTKFKKLKPKKHKFKLVATDAVGNASDETTARWRVVD